MSFQHIRGRFLFREVNERGHDLPLGSVTKEGGVEFRSELNTSVWNPGDDTSSYKRVRPNDFVIGLRSFESGIGHSSIEALVSPAYTVLRPVSTLVHPPYFRHVFKSVAFIARLQNVAQGIRQGRTIATEDFYDIECPVPPINTQRAVADYLDSETARIDALIAKKRQLVERLQELGESLIAHELESVAESGQVPLKFVATIDVSNVDKKSYEGQVSVRLCNYTDVYYNRVIDRSLDFMEATADRKQLERLALRSGDVLITKDSETADDIAVPAFVREDLPGVVLGYHLALIRPNGIRGDFLYWSLRSRRARDHFFLAASGVTRVGLRQDAVGRVLVPAAPERIQAEVAGRLEGSTSHIERASAAIARQVLLLGERRQALITAAVTGGLDIPGAAA